MGESLALTGEQRGLVEKHIGLVTWHIRRNVRGIDAPSRDREWEDLFQEGCIGLARAAKSFDRDRGVAFTTYAVRRIQAAVNRALHTAFATVRIPEGDRAKSAHRAVAMDLDALTKPAADRHRPDDAGPRDTIGERMRSKYDEAVHRARDAAQAHAGRRADRNHLIERLVEERLLVPNDERREPLRQIAREMKSSYSRVANTEKRLVDHVRASLAGDAELSSLRSAARRSREGVNAPVDGETIRSIEASMENRFVERFNGQPRDARAELLLKLMERCGLDARVVARSLFGRLSRAEKASLADVNASCCGTEV